MLWLRSLTLRLLALVAMLSALAGPAWASATAGEIRGTVIDDGGIAIPGVLLTLSSPALIGGAQQRSSDDNGEFIFSELPPGRYEILAQKQGFGAVRKTGVEVVIGRVTTLTIEMKYGGTTITVEEKRKTIDTSSASVGQTFTSDYLSRIPGGRSYQSVVEQTAGVVASGDGNAFAAGAANNENTYLLDGVNVTDPVTGTFGMNFNYDAIEEIQVITGGFDPEYGESLGATQSIVTKSGGNTLETIFYGEYANGNWAPRLDGRYATDGYPLSPTGFDSSYERGEISALVSGPIVRDRIWFLGTYSYNVGRYTSVGIDLPFAIEAHNFFGKLTAQPNSEHRITLSLAVDPASFDNLDQSNPYVEPEAQGRQFQRSQTITGKWNWFINPEANLETTASYYHNNLRQHQVPCTHDEETGFNPCSPDEPENTVDYTTPGHWGSYGAFDSDNFANFGSDIRNVVSLDAKFSLLQVDFLGKHDIKAGIGGSYQTWNWVFGFPGNLVFVDLYANSFDPKSLSNFYYFEVSGYQEYKATGYQVQGFLQDVYKPIENLTFRYGVRYDRSVLMNDVGEPVVDFGVFGPRIYAIWDPWADEKTKIFGGYGRFNDIGRLGVADYVGRAGLGDKAYLGEIYDNFQSTSDQVAGYYAAGNTTLLNDPLMAPHTDQVEVGGQREIIADLSALVQFTGKFTRNVYSFDEVNMIYDDDGYGYIGSSAGEYTTRYRLRTPDIARRDYFQIDAGLQRAWADRWLLNATYSYVISRGTTQFAGEASLSNPSQVPLAYGNLDTDIRHQVKLQAAWDVPDDPWTTTLGITGYFYSGSPVTRYYYSASGALDGGDNYDLLKEPLGTYARTGPSAEIDLRVEQDVPVDKGKLSAVAEVNNVLNTQFASSYYGYYVSAYNRYLIAYRQTGIHATVGAKYEF